MSYLVWIISIVAIIILFPIPLKITLVYEAGIITLKLYNHTVIPRPKKSPSKKKITTPSGEKISKFKLRDIKDILRVIINSPLRFFIWTDTIISYSIDDAAISALCYGLLSQLAVAVHKITNAFFRTKKFNFKIKMEYNRNYFKINNSSIILINLATIIYIVLKIYYRYIERRDPSSRYTT